MCCNSFFKDGTCGVQFNLHMHLCVCLYACLFLKRKNQNIQLLTDPSVSICRKVVIYAWLCMERCRGNEHLANHEQLIGGRGQT